MSDPFLAELATLRTPAPSDLAPTVLLRVGLADEYLRLDSPVGPVFVAYNGRGVSASGPAFVDDAEARFEAGFRERFGRPIRPARRPQPRLVGAIERGLAEGRGRGLHFDLRLAGPFAREVLATALRIPRGEVRPYGWVAREVGHPRAMRAVGTALAHNPMPLLIPCHRVVRSDGLIGAYAWGSPVKRSLLRTEGLDPEAFELAAQHGLRYLGSDTTHIVCLPSCRHARRITPQHQVPFHDLAEAARAGYRPCRDCRP